MAKVIIFNAPPQSGKDTVVEIIMAMNHVSRMYKSLQHMSFKKPLIEHVLKFFDVDRDLWDECYTSEGKEVKRSWLNGLSQREALIWMSEVCIKPQFGKAYFGKKVAEEIDADSNTIYLFSDGGFNAEVIPIIHKVGAENIAIVRVHREGHTFEGDSRTFIDIPYLHDNNYHHLFNYGDKDYLKNEIYGMLEHMAALGFLTRNYFNLN